MASHTRSELFLCLLLLLFLVPVAAGAEIATKTPSSPDDQYHGAIHLFIPEAGAIHSTQITDIINGPQGEVLVATAFGLSTYNGSWSTRHVNRNNISAGLMDDYVTALEFDSAGNLWIGFGDGIQIYNGHDYTVIQDQELLKSLEIRGLQRWNDDMWVATGNSALNRYHNGTWTWFSPYSQNGPGFYEADSMALDSATDTLLVATDHEGLWEVTTSNGTASFDKIQDKDDSFGRLCHVRRDALGGVYFFNTTEVAHFDPATGFTPLIHLSDLDAGTSFISDVTGGSNGALYVATDNGMYVWENARITRHLSPFDGFGTSPRIRTVFTDADNRLWFSTPDEVGYYTGDTSTEPLIVIETMTPTPPPTQVPSLVNVSQTTTSGGVPQQAATSPLDGIFATLSGFFPFLHPSR
jgi:ligand-binding sensor domain-containing protein